MGWNTKKHTTNSIFPADILISHGSDKKEQQQKTIGKQSQIHINIQSHRHSDV